MFRIFTELFCIVFWGAAALLKVMLYILSLGFFVGFAALSLWLIAGGPTG